MNQSASSVTTVDRKTSSGMGRVVKPLRIGAMSLRLLNSFIHGLYTNRLLAQIKQHSLPQHVAMILDGNRRFAKLQGLSDVAEGHRIGADKASEVIQWCDELQIPVVTLWGLSTDNLKRTPEELEKVFALVGAKLDQWLVDPENSPTKRRVNVIGRADNLSEELRDKIKRVEEMTASAGPWQLNIAIGYGGRDEILDALRRLLLAQSENGASLSEVADGLSVEEVRQHLYAPHVPEPDLIIRTSGETRLSGFLLWQSVYSELYFCDAFWPAFRKLDFLRALEELPGKTAALRGLNSKLALTSRVLGHPESKIVGAVQHRHCLMHVLHHVYNETFLAYAILQPKVGHDRHGVGPVPQVNDSRIAAHPLHAARLVGDHQA